MDVAYYDFTVCTDRLADTTDNPLAGKRKTEKTVPESWKTIDGRLQQRSDLLENIVELAALLPSSSALHLSCLILNNTLIYLLGTDHVNPRCRLEVTNIIDKVKPDKVLVELCKLRACHCPQHMSSIFQNPVQFNFSYMRKVITQIGFIPAFIFVADVFNEMQVSSNVNLEFGGEMMGAIRHARTIRHCQLLLGDRSIAVTIRRRASAMNWWTKLRLVLQVSLGLVCRPLRASLLANSHRVAEADGMTPYIFIFERDLCLVNVLQMAASNLRHLKIVAVVGGGHTKGIHRYWGKMRPEIASIIYKPMFDFHHQ